MQYRDHGSDSSYDIVPVPRGTVDTSRHRPPPAPTTVQVDDDFDAITADDGFGTVYGEWAETHEVHHHQENRGYTDSQNEYGRYTNEVEQIFGSDINLEVTRGGRSAGGEAKDNSFSSPMMRNRETNVSQSPLKRGGSMSRSSGEPLQHRGSARGAKVTMWREEVARNEESEYGSDQHDRGAEVIHASGHFQRPRDRTYESGARGGGPVPIQPGESGRIGDSRMRGLSSRRPGEIEDAMSPLRRCLSNASQISHRSERMYTSNELSGHYKVPKGAHRRAKPPSPTRSERMYSMAELKALSSMQAKTSPRSNKMEFGGGQRNDGPASEMHMSRSSNSPPRNPSPPSNQRRSSPPAHGHGSGGTRASSSSSIEMILASCQPTLLHIAPVLASLGIRQEEHLRAMARLREETRDREVKEEVLKKGVSVLEWAILMDRLQSL